MNSGLVNSTKDMEFFCKAGCDVIVTDLPHVLLDLLERIELERMREFLLQPLGDSNDGDG